MPDTVNETAAENRRYGDPVCIDAMRVYDSCGDKDCLSDMPVFFSDASQALIDDAVSVRIRSALSFSKSSLMCSHLPTLRRLRS